VYLGGPPLYLIHTRVKRSVINRGIRNVAKLVESVDTVILDHHLLRTEVWREPLSQIVKNAEKIGHEIQTAAEFLGLSNSLLECRRRELYEIEPPSSGFIKWTKLSRQKRMKTMPPI